ncbi:uncharacterized protein DNG_08649 [Cephalotrichum gorgonifer]|uniref:Uncharacterized protein n=1 Tax=Cephalotrichum gorgonifer TaxID=2041049 RepID=A0AAE8N458_9PEZI|nr:uncharacterized protein DNG_08649 [Cephalotrichum gorgonifer]
MAGPQRPPLTRVVVDASGREYFEPPYQPSVRQSVAPSVRPGESDVIYEGTAPIRHSVAPQLRPRDPEIIYERAGPAPVMPRRAVGPDSYEEGGVIYRRASPPPFPAPRRVVTQPEYGAPDQMGYARAYSVRPMGPPLEDYAPPPDRRPVEGVPRQYTVRSASARPLEAVRYEIPAEGGGHMQVRHDGPPDYAGISRPQSRVEMMGPPVGREYAPRPAEPAGVQRSYSVRPAERYYGEPQPMVGEEVTYVERPPQHGVVYEPMREVYR